MFECLTVAVSVGTLLHLIILWSHGRFKSQRCAQYSVCQYTIVVLFSSFNKQFLGYFDPVDIVFDIRFFFCGGDVTDGKIWRQNNGIQIQWYTSLTLEDSRSELSKVARQCDVSKQHREYMKVLEQCCASIGSRRFLQFALSRIGIDCKWKFGTL